MKFKKKLLATVAAIAMSSSVLAQNLGFEDGTTTGWSGSGLTAVGNQTVQAGSNTWLVKPYGTYMGRIDILSGTSFSQMGTALGLSTGSTASIQNMLNTQAGRESPITTAGWAYRTVNLTAGQNFSLAWQYISTDYVPFNDGSIASLVRVGNDTKLGVINNYTQQYALLGFTNPGTGDYSTNSYGATGWQVSTYSVTESGEYILGFGVFNLDDQTLSPVLFIDEQQGTTTKNGETFGAVAPNEGTLAPTTPTTPTTPTEPTTPIEPPAPTLVNNITGIVTSADLDTAPKFNGGILTMTSGETVSKNITITDSGGTVDANATTSTISGVISNDGNSTNGTLTFTDSQSIGGVVALSGANTYTGSTVINNGAFVVLLNSQALGGTSSVTNNGGLNITGAGNVTVNGSYTQGSDAGLIASLTTEGATQLNVAGQTSLAGTYTLHANQGPYSYGKYTLITGNSVTGQFDTFATDLDSFYGKYLKYSADKVQLYVTPNADTTKASINQVAGDTASALNVQSSRLNSTLGNDCSLFGETGACVSTGVGVVKASGGDLYSGNLTVAKKINDNWRAGLFIDQQANNPTYGTVGLKQSSPAVGGFVTWTDKQLAVQASVATVSNKLDIARQGPETGKASTISTGTAYQLKASYAIPVTEATTVTPYAGVRYTSLSVNGYTEQGPVFPLTVNGTTQTTTDAIAGAGVAHRITEKVTGTVSAGVVQNISYSVGNVSGSSEIANLSTFNSNMPGSGYTSAVLGAGVSYDVAKNQRIGVNVGWQQKSLINTSVGSIGANYTIGF